MEPFFIDGTQGSLFAVYHRALQQHRQGLGLVYLPPFAEEMNRSRRMAALQARRLAALGVDVLLLDPFGTGDSAGDFGDARWEIWREDVKTALDWLGERSGGELGLWGLRLGALLAAEVAAEAPLPLRRLLLWHPVLAGGRHLTQFLRLRMAATMTDPSSRESTKQLQARLSQGEVLEIAGYALSPRLAESIASAKLANSLQNLSSLGVDLLEVTGGEEKALTAATQHLVESLDPKRESLRARAVPGEAFWSIQEITLAPHLLDATDALFRP